MVGCLDDKEMELLVVQFKLLVVAFTDLDFSIFRKILPEFHLFLHFFLIVDSHLTQSYMVGNGNVGFDFSLNKEPQLTGHIGNVNGTISVLLQLLERLLEILLGWNTIIRRHGGNGLWQLKKKIAAAVKFIFLIFLDFLC